MLAGTATEFHIVMAIHVATIAISLGAVFARPLVFALARRHEPQALPILHRVERTLQRWVVWPALPVIVLTGAYMASYHEDWGAFYVGFGIAVVVLIVVALIAVMTPGAKRAQALAERDLAQSGEGWRASAEYNALSRRMTAVATVLGVLILVTLLFMGTEFPS